MEKRTKRWGDRPDAYWIRDLDGLHAIMPHLMNKRTDAEVYVNMEFDVTEALRYIEEKNRGEDEYKTTLFHCILMAVAKTVSEPLHLRTAVLPAPRDHPWLCGEKAV